MTILGKTNRYTPLASPYIQAGSIVDYTCRPYVLAIAKTNIVSKTALPIYAFSLLDGSHVVVCFYYSIFP